MTCPISAAGDRIGRTAVFLACLLAPVALAGSSVPAQQPSPAQTGAADTSTFPTAPAPKPTEPLFLRDTLHDYSIPKNHIPHPLAPYTPTDYPAPRLTNSADLAALLRDGKIYLSLSDAVALALEDNYDIAIARINLDIADTDLLRARAGNSLRGVSTGLVENTIGGSTPTITGGGGPGGTSSSVGGSGTGASGLVLSTNGGGPAPELLDPSLTGNVEYEAQTTIPSTSATLAGTKGPLHTGTATYNFGYTQNFLTGTELSVVFDSSRLTTNSTNQIYSPQVASNFQITATQHLLQGFGTWLNSRFILQAKNDRRIADSAFRAQLLYTINQVEDIYWGLVSAYEDEQAKERALAQSTQLSEDSQTQLRLGSAAPLDVVNAESAVTADKQALIAAQSNLEYQQLLMKQAVARNLNDPQLAVAPVVPTDRVGLEQLPEENMPVEELVRTAYANSPQIEQAVLNMKNNEITIRAEHNGLLPVIDVYGFYGGSGLGGAQNSLLNCGASLTPVACAAGTYPSIGYGGAFESVFNNTAPIRGGGLTITVPIRNRTAQADQARSQMEYRQSQMRLEQLYTQLRIQVINGQFALTNDRAQIAAAQAAYDYAAQSLEAERSRMKFGASTALNLLQQARNLAAADDNLISDKAAYARDRSALEALLATTLDRYGISLQSAADGTLTQKPVVPNLAAPETPAAPAPLQPYVNPAPPQQ